MNHLLFPLLFAFLNPLISAQQLLPNNLPSCAQQCTVLQQGQTGCTPAGGAPVSNEAIYQSCFCQSALLTQLYSNNAVQLCSSCPANDMNTIQNWYKNYCGKGGAPIQGNGNGQNGNNGQQQQPPQTTTAKAPTTTPTSGTNRQGVTNSANQPQEPWMSTHWKWVVMLIVILLGLLAVAIGFWFLHRRYHRRREAHWNLGPASQPDINTWGPGQSVHDLGFGASAATAATGDNEKGKSREQVSQVVQEPARAERRTKGLRKGRGRGRVGGFFR